MATRIAWSRQQLLVAFRLYCQLPFGKMHARNPDIIRTAAWIGRTPDALAMKLTNIASLDPAITSTGRKGLGGASAADRAMWEEMQADWELFAVEAHLAVPAEGEFGAAAAPAPLLDDIDDYTGQNKTILTTARIGQEYFRRAVLSSYNGRCCVSGLAVPTLLVASHIIPWRIDEKQRLNPRNGLCLSTLHDKAFDAGIIAIAEDMTVCVSRRHADDGDSFFKSALLAYDGKPIDKPDKFGPLPEFLDYHRRHIFEW